MAKILFKSGAENPMWRGGRVVDPRGYVLIRVGKDHPLADCRGYAYEHRLNAYRAGLLEPSAGRSIHVHHEDENKANNDGSNLDPATPAVHRMLHRKKASGLRMPGEENQKIPCACGCGAQFDKFDGSGRPRRFLPSHNLRR